MANYYIDNAGNDSNSGLVGFPWQTKTKVNSFTFSPGDSLIFTNNQSFAGPFIFVNSGAANNYICIGTGRLNPSGAGLGLARLPQLNPAIITCGDGDGIDLNDCEFISVDNLIVVGSGVNINTGATTSTGLGISLSSTQSTNKLRSNRITACTVTGTQEGIYAVGGHTASQVGYNDLQYWGCLVHAVQNHGFVLAARPGDATNSATQNSNLYIGRCQAYDLPGLPGGIGVGQTAFGFDIQCTNIGIIEYCVAHDINKVGDWGSSIGGSAGFILFITNSIVLQYIESYNILANQTTPIDGMAFDIESSSSNNILQYSYGHDCNGPGITIGTALAKPTTGNIIHHNIFARNSNKTQSDPAVEMWNFGDNSSTNQPVTSTFYNNTVYASNGDAYSNVPGTSIAGADVLYNNILISKAGSKCINGTVVTSGLGGNLYYALGGGTISVKPSATTYTSIASLRAAGYESAGGSNGLFGDPALIAPTTFTSGTLPLNNVSSVTGFNIPSTSIAKHAGIDLTVSPYSITLVQDFHGFPFASWTGRDIGASQFMAATTFTFDVGSYQIQHGDIVYLTDNIRARLVNSSITPLKTDTTINGYTGIGTDAVLVSKTITNDTSLNRTKYSATNPTITISTSGDTWGCVVIYKHITDDTDSVPIFCLATTGITDGNNEVLQVNANGLGFTQNG